MFVLAAFVLRDAIAFRGPLTKVNEFAAFAAEWAVGAVAAPYHFLAALRAHDHGWFL